MVEEYEECVRSVECDSDGWKHGNWKPTRGIVVNLELEKRLLNSLGDLADADGVKSVYQMIRNALYAYVNYRMSRMQRQRRRGRRNNDTNCNEPVRFISDPE